jgi:hypothetical protein
MNRIVLIAALFVASSAAAAQQRFAITIDTAAVSVTMNVQYATSDTTRLSMDVYAPRSGPRTGRTALVIFNRAMGATRSAFFPASWARFAAARGLVAILPDLRDGREGQDFRLLMNTLVTRADEFGIDRDAIVMYAGSATYSLRFLLPKTLR